MRLRHGQEAEISRGHKIATCCYCGTRAALVLRGESRHELSCAACGAPLHNLKFMPLEKPARPKKNNRPMSRAPRKKSRAPSRRKRKSLFADFLDDAWDAVEDIFD